MEKHWAVKTIQPCAHNLSWENMRTALGQAVSQALFFALSTTFESVHSRSVAGYCAPMNIIQMSHSCAKSCTQVFALALGISVSIHWSLIKSTAQTPWTWLPYATTCVTDTTTRNMVVKNARKSLNLLKHIYKHSLEQIVENKIT